MMTRTQPPPPAVHARTDAPPPPAVPAPTFSVVIPAYNAEAFLADTLRSVLAQRDDDFEVIVVDDGSTDRTADLAAAFEPEVRLIRQANGGCHAARNAGIDAASGRYVCFLDADDLWFPWTLAAYRRTLDLHHDAAVVMAHRLVFTDEAELADARDGKLMPKRWDDFFAGGDRSMWTGTSLLVIDRERLAGSGRRFALGCLSDLDFLLRVGDLGAFIKMEWPPTVGYRVHRSNLSGSGRRLARAVREVLACERRGEYAGGPARRRERRRIISLHCAAMARAQLRRADRRAAAAIYARSLPVHVAARRWDAIWKWPGHALRRSLSPAAPHPQPRES